MTDHENAIGVMKDLFGRDYQFALSTAKNNIPSSVWQEWFPNEGQKYQANSMATLEVYSAGDPAIDATIGLVRKVLTL